VDFPRTQAAAGPKQTLEKRQSSVKAPQGYRAVGEENKLQLEVLGKTGLFD